MGCREATEELILDEIAEEEEEDNEEEAEE